MKAIDLQIGHRRVRKLTLKLLWDLFMVWVALANLGLIVFDLSYLLIRPLCVRYAPVICHVYDPVKGIEPHPLTRDLIESAARARQLLELSPSSEHLQDEVENLRRLTLRVMNENPFERSGQTRKLEQIKVHLAAALGRRSDVFDPVEHRVGLIEQVWTAEPAVLAQRLETFEQGIAGQLAVSYYREIDLRGQLVDWFWLLDLPFLALFWVEFVTRWALAVRRRTYAKWFFFPIFYWYDLLGLIPSAYFRPFRLLRAAGIYMRLRRSELSTVGDDIISRSVAYVSSIITEEVSDMVSLRILAEYQEEIRDGTHLRIFEQTIGARRAEIHQVVARQIREVLTNRDAASQLGDLLRLNLDTAVSQSEALQSIPLPSAVVRPIVRAVGEILLETTLETVVTTINSEDGRDSIDALVSTVLDQLLSGPGLVELESVSKEIALDILEHMKEAVAVKKWAVPDPGRAGQHGQVNQAEQDEPVEPIESEASIESGAEPSSDRSA